MGFATEKGVSSERAYLPCEDRREILLKLISFLKINTLDTAFCKELHEIASILT